MIHYDENLELTYEDEYGLAHGDTETTIRLLNRIDAQIAWSKMSKKEKAKALWKNSVRAMLIMTGIDIDA